MLIFGNILMGLGVLSTVYFLGYAFYIDLNNAFTYFWLVLGIGCLLIGGWVRHVYRKGNTLPRVFSISILSLAGAVLLFFGIMIGMLIHDAYTKPKQDADYMILLGARVKGSQITTNLKYRLEVATEYLSDNLDTMVVVSGGQGEGENLSEAEAMRNYLIEHGILADRILLEDGSVNTDQNIRNSLNMIQDYEKSQSRTTEPKSRVKRIVLVSNGFHLYRATRIAGKQLKELQDEENTVVEGLGSRTMLYTLPTSYVREVFAVLKYRLYGQI